MLVNRNIGDKDNVSCTQGQNIYLGVLDNLIIKQLFDDHMTSCLLSQLIRVNQDVTKK